MDPITIAILGLVIAGAGLGVSLGNPTINAWLKRSRKRKGLYKTVLKKSTDLQPEEVMGEVRGSSKDGFREYCLPRDEIDQIRKRIAEGKDVLVIGNPLAGKSRAVYEALKHTANPCDVTIPRIVDVNPNELDVRQYISGTRKGVLLVDDINKYVGKQHFEFLLQQYIDKGYLIIATCRKGPELAKAESALEQVFGSLFNEPIELGKVDREEAEAVANVTGIAMPDEYDGNIGSIFVPIKAMRLRYSNECSDRDRAVLRSIKRLFMGGVYEEGGIYSEAHIKKVCEELEELTLKKFKWQPVLDKLAELAFIRPGKDGIAVEETYIEQIFTFDPTLLDNFHELANLFSDDPKALFKVGDRANGIEYSEDLGDDYVRVKRLAAEAFIKVLPFWAPETHTEMHAKTQINLGIAYWRLGAIEDKATNCRLAISANQEALNYDTLERSPMEYANAQNNLGVAYRTLGDIEDRADNCKRAIAACHKALKVYTLDRFPMEYAMTQNNLGAAFQELGVIEDRAANCNKAIAAYQEALKVSTLERFPLEYAAAQNNLGNAYQNIDEFEEAADNLQLAIAAFNEALKIRTLERFPIDYALTQNNLGAAYLISSTIEERPANCKKASVAFLEALKVRTLDRFPMDYAMTQNNLGLALQRLGDIEDKAVNCKSAREAWEAALSVFHKLGMPMQVGQVERNIAILDAFEAEG